MRPQVARDYALPRIYDLHSHSDQSDGILSPEALVSRAKRQDVSVLALTDHDTVTGLYRAQRQAALEEIELIAGIEFSAHWNGRNIHVVGLNIDIERASLCDAVAEQEALRNKRAEVIGAKLEGMGVKDAYEGAKTIAGEGVIGRPHFAAYLVKHGYAKSVQAAFKVYLGAGKPGDVKQMWPELDDVVGTICKSGGVAVIAHPAKYNMTRTKLCLMLEDFKDAGGLAMEVVSGKQQPDVTKNLAGIAKRFGLLGSCGSDFHVPDQKWQELGQFSPLPDDIEPVWGAWE